MKIQLKEVTIREVANSYINNAEEGVIGFGGKLNIRPAYQREFIYKDKQRNAVIDTVRRNFPLNVMYWSKNDQGTPDDETDDTYELLDGQQRTISICEYVAGSFAIKFQYFHNLTEEEQKQILDYKLTIYLCEGADKEKLDWFRIINIAGVKLADQELRNAVYTGPWLTSAKKYFSKTGCAAYDLAKNYMTGSPIRQDYLEKAIDWINNGNIEEYMASYQHEKDALDLWTYFQRVITWIKTTFPNYRREMKRVNWGQLYNQYSAKSVNTDQLEQEVSSLMLDDDVTKKSGIYPYILTRDEKYLSIRSFTGQQKREAYEKQKGICPLCSTPDEQKHFEIEEMEADHITPWSKGGKTTSLNCQMLCKQCNRTKSGK